MLLERFFKMSECGFRWLLGCDLRRFTQWCEQSANGALGLVKSFPDAIRGGIGESAFQIPEGLQFVVGADRLFQKCPQAVS